MGVGNRFVPCSLDRRANEDAREKECNQPGDHHSSDGHGHAVEGPCAKQTIVGTEQGDFGSGNRKRETQLAGDNQLKACTLDISIFELEPYITLLNCVNS